MKFQSLIFPFIQLSFILSSLFGLIIADLNSDKKALLEFSSSVLHSPRLNWNNSIPICSSWIGITCNSNETHVISIHLPGIGFKGSIPNNTLGKLDSLRILSLHSNELSGNLPSDILSIPSLQYVNLQHNNFTGLIPSSVSTKLIALDLSFNSFSGRIPSKFQNLKRLKYLNLSYNNLNGSVPISINQFPYTSFVGNSLLCGPPLNQCSAVFPSPIHQPLTPSARQNQKATTSKKFFGVASILALAVGGFAFLFLLVLVIFVCFLKRKKSNILKGKANCAGKTEISKSFGSGVLEAERNKLFFFEGCSYSFDHEDLLKASAEVLGKGSYGTTYKVTLEQGITVVVKRLREVVVRKKEFEQEMEFVGRIGQHSNVISLQAYYYSKDEKFLVYNYISGGSLFSLLHGNRSAGGTPLVWDSRMKIALGTANGIASIHKKGGPKFVHGNIKSSNVLITQEHDGCITDVGLTPLMNTPSTMSRANSYQAPEVAESRNIMTQKSDVYSFGVLLLEMLTGKIPFGYHGYDHDIVDLPRWVRSVVHEEWTAEVFDEELMRGEYVEEEMVQMLQIALACVSKVADNRPTMDEVVGNIVEIRYHELKNRTSSESESNLHTP